MSIADQRPRWMLRKHARISQRRLTRFGKRADQLDAVTWWQQIGEAAADLSLDVGLPTDWQAWTDRPVAVDDGGDLL